MYWLSNCRIKSFKKWHEKKTSEQIRFKCIEKLITHKKKHTEWRFIQQKNTEKNYGKTRTKNVNKW